MTNKHNTIAILDSFLSSEEYVDYNMLLTKEAVSKVLNFKSYAMMAFGILIVAIGLYKFIQDQDDFPIASVLLVSLALILIFLVPIRTRAIFKKKYADSATIKAPTTYFIAENLVTVENEFGRSKMSWALFTRADSYKKWVLLHLNNQTFLALDTTKIQAPATASDLLPLLKQHNIILIFSQVA